MLAPTPSDHKAWLVDLDGTLYRARWVKLLMAAELGLFGFPVLKVLRRFRKEHECIRHEATVAGADPFSLQLERTAAGLDLPAERVATVVQEWMFHRPGKWLRLFRNRALCAALSRFREQGGKTALVSDYPARVKLAALGIQSLFDVVVASGEPGGPKTLKPNPQGYLQAAQQLEVRPEHCLVIGDREDADGAAARAAKMGFFCVR